MLYDAAHDEPAHACSASNSDEKSAALASPVRRSNKQIPATCPMVEQDRGLHAAGRPGRRRLRGMRPALRQVPDRSRKRGVLCLRSGIAGDMPGVNLAGLVRRRERHRRCADNPKKGGDNEISLLHGSLLCFFPEPLIVSDL